jgi:hypothetical protein
VDTPLPLPLPLPSSPLSTFLQLAALFESSSLVLTSLTPLLKGSSSLVGTALPAVDPKTPSSSSSTKRSSSTRSLCFFDLRGSWTSKSC